jgi:hypothetical protein
MTKEEIKLLLELGYSPKEVMEMTVEDARRILDAAEKGEPCNTYTPSN